MKNVLVTYATRAGTTAEVAERVALKLSALGFAAEARPLDQVAGLSAYQAVVVGAPVRYGQWLAPAAKFVERHQAALRQMPVAFFAMHLMNQGDTPADAAARQGFTAAARKSVTPVAEGVFTGVGDLEKVSLFERLIGRAVKSPIGDFRDWAAIEAWAERLGQLL